MDFFYNLNKKLNGIRELPETTHKQLNESKPDFLDLDKDGDTKEPMKKAAKEKPDYQSKLQDKFGGSASDLTKGLTTKSKKVNESSHSIRDVLAYEIKMILDGAAAGDDQTDHIVDELGDIFNDIKASRDKVAMMAYEMMVDTIDEDADMQAVAARKALALLKNNSANMAEGNYSKDAMELNPDFAKVGRKPGVMGKIAQGVKKVADFVAPGDEDLLRDLERKTGGRRPTKEAAAPIDFDKVLDAIAALYGDDIWENDAMQDLANDLEQAGPTDRELDFIIAKGKLPKRLANTQFSAGDNVRFGEAAAPMSAKQKSFAALAEPKDKITFADKIAGAKKEVDEMLGDVAAEAMKSALGQGKQPVRGMAEAADKFTQADWNKVARKKRHLMMLNPNLEPEDAEQMAAEKLGYDYEDVLTWIESDQNMEEAVKEIPGGRRHTSEPGGYGRKDDEDAPRVQTQRGRGRPKKNADSETGQVMKPDWSAFGVGGKVNLPKHKGKVTKHKMVGESPDQQQVQQIYNDLAEIRAAAKQAQRGGQFPQGFASQLESVLWSAMTLIQNQQPGDAQVREGADPKTWTTIEDVEFIEDLMDRAFASERKSCEQEATAFHGHGSCCQERREACFKRSCPSSQRYQCQRS